MKNLTYSFCFIICFISCSNHKLSHSHPEVQAPSQIQNQVINENNDTLTVGNFSKEIIADGKFMKGHIYLTATSKYRNGIIRIHTKNLQKDEVDDIAIACLYDFHSIGYELPVGYPVYARVSNTMNVSIADSIIFLKDDSIDFDTLSFDQMINDELYKKFNMELHGTLGTHDYTDGGSQHVIWHILNREAFVNPNGELKSLSAVSTEKIVVNGVEYIGIEMESKDATKSDTMYFKSNLMFTPKEIASDLFFNQVFVITDSGKQKLVVSMFSTKESNLHTYDNHRH